mgnify:CR=1 FL=1
MKNSRNEKGKKMGRKSRLDSIEAKIEKAQQRVSITCERYEAATAQLKELLDKRDELRKEEIFNAMSKSRRSYEDILKYIKSR